MAASFRKKKTIFPACSPALVYAAIMESAKNNDLFWNRQNILRRTLEIFWYEVFMAKDKCKDNWRWKIQHKWKPYHRAINYLSCNVGMTPEKYLQLTKIVNKQGFKRGIVYQIVRLISRFTMKLHIIWL